MSTVNDKTNGSGIRHIAFIMDGNGRWAQKRAMPREYGHKQGVKSLEKVIKACVKHNIPCATFYAFSTENWKRPQKEVDAIMSLIDQYLDRLIEECDKNDVQYRFIGEIDGLNATIKDKIHMLECKGNGKPFTVNIALNYGSRSELVHACKEMIASGKSDITESDIDAALYTAHSPELDLLVRTGGELRLSNFLLWQAAYAELYFTDVLWPDMNEEHVKKIVDEFNNRKRRFGGI